MGRSPGSDDGRLEIGKLKIWRKRKWKKQILICGMEASRAAIVRGSTPRIAFNPVMGYYKTKKEVNRYEKS